MGRLRISVVSGAVALLFGTSVATASAPPIWSLKNNDAVELAPADVACLVQHRPGAATNGLICFVESHTSSFKPKPKSFVAVLAERGLAIANASGHDVFLKYQPSVAGRPGYAKTAVPLKGGVGRLADGQKFMVGGTNLVCAASLNPVPELLCAVTDSANQVPYESYGAVLEQRRIGVVQWHPSKASVVFQHAQP